MKTCCIFLTGIALVFSACSSGIDPKKVSDTATDGAQIISIQTDSGRIEVDADGKAVLYYENGKVKARGEYVEGKPAGAWIRYDENGNVISAAHLSDGKPLYQLDKNDFEFRTWKNEKLGAQFNVPKEWKEVPSPNPALVASFEKTISDTAIHIRPNFNIARAQLQPGDSLAGLAQLQLNMLHESMGRVDIVEEAYITIDGCKAFRRYGMYFTGDNKVGFLNLIIVSGNDAWFFSCEAQNKNQGEFLLYQGVFQQITESFHRIK